MENKIVKNVVCLVVCGIFLVSCSNLQVKPHNGVGEFDAVTYGYTADDVSDIKLNGFHIPLIPVKVNDYTTWLELDFGSSGCITLTTHIQDNIRYSVTGEQNSYWSDGRVRGTIQNIIVDNISLNDMNYPNHACVLADWKMYSSLPFNGLVGLRYFFDRRITIDYGNKKLYVSTTGLPDAFKESSGAAVIPLIPPPEHFPSGLFAPGKINGHDTVVYIDSGNSETSINKKYFRTTPASIELELGGQAYTVSKFHEDGNLEFQNFRNDIGIVLGSDFLKDCVITIDRAQGNNQMILLKK